MWFNQLRSSRNSNSNKFGTRQKFQLFRLFRSRSAPFIVHYNYEFRFSRAAFYDARSSTASCDKPS